MRKRSRRSTKPRTPSRDENQTAFDVVQRIRPIGYSVSTSVTATVQGVEYAASQMARNLPEAHFSFEFWKKAWFRRAADDFVRVVYDLDINGFSDEGLARIEELVGVGISAISIHLARLRDDTRDTIDREYFERLLARLRTALEGLAQGLPPDPAKRPTREELLKVLARGLRESKAV